MTKKVMIDDVEYVPAKTKDFDRESIVGLLAVTGFDDPKHRFRIVVTEDGMSEHSHVHLVRDGKSLGYLHVCDNRADWYGGNDARLEYKKA